MERLLKPKDIPISHIWEYTNTIAEELSTLYHKPYHRHLTVLNALPRVVTFNSKAPDHAFEVFPRHTSKSNNHYRRTIIDQMIRQNTPARYHRSLGFFYDRDRLTTDSRLTRSLTEETTHHVTRYDVNSDFMVDSPTLRKLNQTVGERGLNYGDRLAEAVESLRLISDKPYIDFDLTSRVSVDEFFVPISLAHILKSDYTAFAEEEFERPTWDWLYVYFPKGEEENTERQQENYRRASRIVDTVTHLPYFAGHKLLMEYGGRADDLLDDYPELAHLPPVELWKSFIVPLLFETR